MDIGALTAFLAPFLPHLVKFADRAADEAGKLVGDEAGGLARRIWERLRPKVDEEPVAQAAVKEVAANPDDQRSRGFLELQLEKLVASDEALAADLARLWREVPASTVTASGERSVAVGRDVSGVINTGDDVRIE